MDIRIYPSPLRGRIQAIQSKSHAHRGLICAALAGAFDLVSLVNPSEDLLATQQVVNIFRSADVADCRESGTTLRLCVPPAAALGLSVTFTGTGRLPDRPMEPLIDVLEAHGVSFSDRRLPFRLSGRLESGRYDIAGDISSQYISGLLLALPLLAGDSEIRLTTPLESAGYVDMTIDCQRKFGIDIEETDLGWRVPGEQIYTVPPAFSVEGDWSNAAFWLVASELGQYIGVEGLSGDSLQKDRRITRIIDHDERDIDIRDIPDLVPVLAVLAAGRKGETILRNGRRLRLKESDRIASTVAMIRNLGGTIQNRGDDLFIKGTGKLHGGEVSSAGDHRIAMAAAVAAILCDVPVLIRDAHVVAKSYPNFFDDYNALGGLAHVV